MDTYWCKARKGGSATDEGIGEWLRVDLPSATSVRKLRVAIGNGYDAKSFTQNSRPVELRAEFSDGSTRDLALEDRAGWQEVDLGAKTLSWVKLTVQKVASGTRWHDTAIADVQFVR